MDRLSGLGAYPIVALGVGSYVLTVGVMLLGRWLRRRVDRARADKGKTAQSEMVGPVISSILGLLALLLGFTFALAVDRFEARRGLVLEEANDIGTTYLQAQLLPDVHRARVSALLVSYTDNRIAMAEMLASGTSDAQSRLLRRNDALVEDLWSATVAAFPSMQPGSYASRFIESMNKVIDLDTSRKVSRLVRVPTQVLLALFAYILVSAVVLGFVTTTRTVLTFTCILNALVVLALMLIVDIDRPALGGIRESQDAMLMLQRSLHAQPPGTFDRWRDPAPLSGRELRGRPGAPEFRASPSD